MLKYREAEGQAERILVDGMGEALVLKKEEGYYALYFKGDGVKGAIMPPT